MKKILLAFVLTFSLVAVAVPTPAHAAYDIGTKVCDGINPDGVGTAKCDDTGGVTKIFKQVINVLSFLVGAISVIMIIVGGFRYMISGGDSNAVSAAKNTILYAVVGLVIAILAQALVRFVFTKASNAGCVPNPTATPPVTCS